MSQKSTHSPGEIVTLALLAFFALCCLIFVLIAALTPDKATGVLAAQNSFLALGPLVGSLGAMAMIWLRNRVRPAKLALALAATLWMIGATLVGLGVFTAFLPGDRSILTNLGYSVALCLTPGAVLSLLGLGTFWYSQRRNSAEDVGPANEAAPQTTGADSAPVPNHDDLRRRGQSTVVGSGIQSERRTEPLTLTNWRPSKRNWDSGSNRSPGW